MSLTNAIVSHPKSRNTQPGYRLGDLCDSCPGDVANDADRDGICRNIDNCPVLTNSNQANFDGDGESDACDCNCDFDIDGDAVVDANDACLLIETGSTVDGDGCAIEQLCPCDGGWRNHGAYVKCVAHSSEDFVEDGLITEA
jgi:hypothetical protein